MLEKGFLKPYRRKNKINAFNEYFSAFLIPFPIVTAIILLCWSDLFLSFWICSSLWFLSVPAVILSIVFFLIGLRWRKIWHRMVVVWGGFNLLLLVAYLLLRLPNQQCDPDIMARHYEKHHTGMEELHRYVRSAIADSCAVTMEFRRNTLMMFDVSVRDEFVLTNQWGMDGTLRIDSLMTIAGLSQEECDGICKRLKKMGCVGIEYSQMNPVRLTIWFRRVGMGLYSYNIYSRPMNEEEKTDATEGWEYITYNDRCTFEFGGGAVGPQSFGHEVKEEFLQRHQPW